jgi:hypothetical protein
VSSQRLRLKDEDERGKGILTATHIWSLMTLLDRWNIAPLCVDVPGDADSVYRHLQQALEAVVRQLEADVPFVLGQLLDGATVAEAVAQDSATVALPLGTDGE